MKSHAIAVLTLLVCTACRCGGGPVPELPSKLVGRCEYTNRFSNSAECRDYLGEWTEKEAGDDCRGQGSEVELAAGCDTEAPRLGFCILGEGEKFTRITLPGEDASKCSSARRGCEFFGGGIFDPAPVCGGELPDSSGTGLPTFRQPTRSCVDPKPGEPPGKSDGGQVCTWSMISGATESQRKFTDYGDCEIVRTQRPYYPARTEENADREDSRLADPAYAAELAWVKQEIQATACVCCHSTAAPRGTSNWYLESGPNFANSFFPRGLAMGAGWIDTVGFGAYPPEENNGFTRATPDNPAHSIFVTTDNARMVRFFEAELAHRGMKRSDFPPVSYGAGPLDAQRMYRPSACVEGEGMSADGTLNWLNGGARYVYVLEENAASPAVPPNLDLPTGTVWRLDVPDTGMPVSSGTVRYGEVPSGMSQRFPASGPPPALVSGKTYYLYVLADIAIPNTRCLFTAP